MSEAIAKVSKTINASREVIWAALTTPAILKKFFFGADIETDWQVGNPIHMKGFFRGEPFYDKGRILVFEPRNRLSFSQWSELSGEADTPENYHVVSFGLVPLGRQTIVTLTQSNLIGGARSSDIKHKSDYEKNWHQVLDGLAGVVTKNRSMQSRTGELARRNS